ncbi:MAG: hypothetical protein WDA53_10125 [Bacillota bacterium]
MKIDSSAINMTAQYQKIELYQREERLEMWIGERPPAREQGKLPAFIKDMLELSEEAKQKFKDRAIKQAVAVEETAETEIENPGLQKIMILKALLEKLTGKKFNFLIPKKINYRGQQPGASVPATGAERGWGLEYDLRESYYQKERMSFSAEGVVKTADGREINFSVNLNLTKEFAYQNQISFRAGEAVKVDPLVVHFNTFNPSLTDQKYEFDLDADGQLDTISFVGPGSGFLAVDFNGDGVINDGTELFGPQTGNGFAELAKYDEDGNGWIDENDSIYEQLVIWTKDEKGNDRLFALGEKGIGAIYLGNVSTPFGLTGNQNQLQGEIAQTGVFLHEDGRAGLIQHIDLVV